MVLEDIDEQYEYDDEARGGEDDVRYALEQNELLHVEITAVLVHARECGEMISQGESRG